MQQSHARVVGVHEILDPAEFVGDAIRMQEDSLVRHAVKLRREFSPVEKITVDRHTVIQIIVNLLQNAKRACGEHSGMAGEIIVRLGPAALNRIQIEVEDNGVGIPPENLTRIFSHGFTTRKNGHGFGLHSGALAAKQFGGSLTVQSAGPGLGARFTLELPREPVSNPVLDTADQELTFLASSKS